MHDHLSDLRTRSARDVSVANGILCENDIISQSCGISGSSRDTDVCHVTRQDDLLGAGALQVLIERSVREGTGVVLLDDFLAALGGQLLEFILELGLGGEDGCFEILLSEPYTVLYVVSASLTAIRNNVLNVHNLSLVGTVLLQQC